MGKMIFSNADTRAVFENVNGGILAFSDLMTDVAKGKEIFNAEGEVVSKEKANKKIREVMFSVLGLDENADRREIRRAIRRHKVDVYEVIENTIQDMLVSGWGANPYFNEFVELKSAALGDTNEFYTEDNVILTVSELSGNHHNLFRQRLGEGSTFQVKTSWYGLNF